MSDVFAFRDLELREPILLVTNEGEILRKGESIDSLSKGELLAIVRELVGLLMNR